MSPMIRPAPPQVAETCQLAVRRLEWLKQRGGAPEPAGRYLSVDPAPPAEERDVGQLREALLDESRPLFERYRAMFALRDAGGEDAALALAEGKWMGARAPCFPMHKASLRSSDSPRPARYWLQG